MTEPTQQVEVLEVRRPAGMVTHSDTGSAEQTGIVLAAREKALVEARYVVAMRQPRSIDVVRANLQAPAEAVARRVLDAALAHASGQPQIDDVTAVVIIKQ